MSRPRRMGLKGYVHVPGLFLMDGCHVVLRCNLTISMIKKLGLNFWILKTYFQLVFTCEHLKKHHNDIIKSIFNPNTIFNLPNTFQLV